MAVMAKYVQYLFNLQHNTARTVIQQNMHLTAHDEHSKAISSELEQLKHDNFLLCNGTLPPSDQDRELKDMYHRLSKVEHRWNYSRQQLNAPCEVVDERTHAIIHLEHANERQDLNLEERAAVITSLEQQLQVVQLQVPPAPGDPTEPDTMSDVDELEVMVCGRA
jgi:hypothetical protein